MRGNGVCLKPQRGGWASPEMQSGLHYRLAQISVDLAQSGFDLQNPNAYDSAHVRRRLLTG